MRRSVLTVLALLGLGLTVPTSAAQADSTHNVGLTGFADMVVDQAHGHVFISQGSGTVVVTDLSGAKVGSLTGLPGADGMTLSDDGSALFVALSSGAAIAEVNTTHPLADGAVTTFSTGANTCPLDVAYTSGRVWYAATCDGQWANLHALDPATGTITDTLNQVFNPRLAADPAVPDTFFAGDQGSFPAQFYKFTVTEGTEPTLTQTSDFDVAASSLGFSHDGATVVTGDHREFSTTDLSPVRGYPVAHSRNAVAVRASDDLVAFGTDSGVVFYRHGQRTAFGKAVLGTPKAIVAENGLAFGATNVYAVSFTGVTHLSYRLDVIKPRRLTRVSVSVSGSHFRFGKKSSVTATLHSATTSRRLTLLAITTDGVEHLVKTGRVDSRGHLRAKPFMTEAVRFAAVFEGDATFGPAVAVTPKVKVAALVAAKLFKATGHSGKYSLYPTSKSAFLGAAVGPNHRGDCLFFRAQILLGGHWGHDSTTGCVRLNKRSGAGARLDGAPALAGIPLRMRAEWRGDPRNTSATSPWRYLKFVSSRTASARTLGPDVVSPRLSAWRR